jgi:putative nucleotidyltransferase with HDIG domain
MEEKFYDKLKERVKDTLGEKGSHDFNHVERVYNYSIIISKELDVDLEIVKVSALLHDISKHKEVSGKIQDHAAHGAIEARKILEKLNFPKEKIEIVCKCILLHNKKQDLSETKEVRVLQEADGLEAIGAIGIARAFSYTGEKNPWNNSFPESPVNELIRYLSVDYFKLPVARELAKRKIELTKNFCDSFVKECNMEITN